VQTIGSFRHHSHYVALVVALFTLLLAGCVGFNPANEPLERHDPAYGYRTTDATQHRDHGRATLYLAFSGGGTRAAAFAYGVLEELRDTEITVDGVKMSLLEEIDTISGVSGGSFPAAYYGLYGDRIFDDFEARFLKKNIQRALVWRILRPWNLVRLMTPWLSRSDLASRYYNENLFDGATFADLRAAKGPRININSTDLSSGGRITFNQTTFDMICSDLDVFLISTAVAASSAVPMLLSPITLKNYAGTCGFEPPEWVDDFLANADADPRRAQSAAGYLVLQDRERKKFIHLVDGGISDNLGLRAAIDFLAAVGGIEAARRIHDMEVPDHLAVIVVNAETDPNPKINLTSAAPSFAQLMNSISGGQIRRYNFETLVTMETMLRDAGREFRESGYAVSTQMINVSFDGFDDEVERRYFKLIPTSFSLSDEEVDGLRNAGRRLLRASDGFQRLVEAMQ